MKLCLGIDIGTTSTAAVVWDPDSGKAVEIMSAPHGAAVDGLPEHHAEQDADVLLESAKTMIGKVASRFGSAIQAVGVTGQMHGVVLVDEKLNPICNLVTWQDRRAESEGFIERLKDKTGSNRISGGYGAVTLAWLSSKGLLQNASKASTIQDLLVARLVGAKTPFTDFSDACSWGFFDESSGKWNFDQLDRAEIPRSLLPNPVIPGSVAGRVSRGSENEYRVPESIPVVTAIGDNQASIYASTADHVAERVLILSLGTSAQISAVMPQGFRPSKNDTKPTFEYRPYLGDRVVGVVPSYTGGMVLDWFVATLGSWCKDLGLGDLDKKTIFERLNRLGSEALESDLSAKPTIFGERFLPDLKGTIEGIGPDNFSLGGFYKAFINGVIKNLNDLMAPQCLDGRNLIVGTGNALRLQPLIQACVREVFKLPLKLCEFSEEAAQGAARLASLVAADG